MRHDKLEKELDLLLLLTDNHSLTLPQISEKLSISRRNLYYYLEFFRDCGFVLEKTGQIYAIDRSSPFFKKLVERITFTEEEAITIRRLLGNTRDSNAIVESLKRKMDRFYDFGILSVDKVDEQVAQNVAKLHDAIKYERQVVLKGYSSPHSHTKRDRLVEPFLLMDGNREVRCFEPASGMNKTFKVLRMEDVLPLEEGWRHKAKHRKMITDIFMFSGDKTVRVELALGQLSFNILAEEYPRAMDHIKKLQDDRWLLSIDVCSYIGIGRFVLGLLGDITVLGDDGFRKYLRDMIEQYNSLV